MLILLGSNHRSAPVDFRERLSTGPEIVPELLAGLKGQDGVAEALVLSTCNRVEFLVRSADPSPDRGLEAIGRVLQARYSMTRDEIERYTYHYVGRAASEHLFRVAAGIDSMILGEPQILGQVKQAYQQARQHEGIGPVLDRLLQQCLASAKRVRTDTGIARHAVSVAFAAVELARSIFGDLKSRRALLIGAGKMGDLVAQHLVANGINELIVTSRRYTTAVALASRFEARAVHWDEGLAGLGDADIVVSSTGAPSHVLTAAEVRPALRSRRGEPLFLIDIAVPRDIDPAVNRLEHAYLYDIDDLQGVVDSNMKERRRAAEQAGQMILEEVQNFERWRQAQAITPLIVALREQWHAVGRGELERARRKLGPLSDRQEQRLEEMTRGLIQKILHRPIRHLRRAAERGEVQGCRDLFADLFGLDGDAPRQPEKSKRPEPDEESGPRGLLKGGKE